MTLRALLMCLLIGCAPAAPAASGSPPPPEPVAVPAAPPAPPAAPATQARHFETERVYEGNCAPAGTRGGCYRLTLRPDGTMAYLMLDAAVKGTYVIDGDTITITMAPGETQQFALSADRTMAGELKLKP